MPRNRPNGVFCFCFNVLLWFSTNQNIACSQLISLLAEKALKLTARRWVFVFDPWKALSRCPTRGDRPGKACIKKPITKKQVKKRNKYGNAIQAGHKLSEKRIQKMLIKCIIKSCASWAKDTKKKY